MDWWGVANDPSLIRYVAGLLPKVMKQEHSKVVRVDAGDLFRVYTEVGKDGYPQAWRETIKHLGGFGEINDGSDTPSRRVEPHKSRCAYAPKGC